MAIDGEGGYEAIRRSVNLEIYSPDRLAEMWKEAFGEGEKHNVMREKFKNIGGELTADENVVLEGARLTTVDGESLLTWREGEERRHLRINGESSIGIQNHEGGEKSVVVVRSSLDRASGGNKQTTRRFTAVK